VKRLIMAAVAAMLVLGAAAPAMAANPLLKEIEEAFIEIGEKVLPSVVSIEVERASAPEGQRDMQNLEELLRMFGEPEGGGGGPFPAPRRPVRPSSSGSGFVYDTQGHIITNNHVISGAAKITVGLQTGEEFEATLVGSDPQTDIAVLKIDAGRDLTAAVLGDSSALRVGQFTIAAGSPFSLESSLSFGHVTALGRDGADIDLGDRDIRFFDFIQTDAAINLGNSGGPLCNIDGEVIGINVAIVWRASALGFAIPSDTARKIVPVLIAEGKITRGYLGVIIKDASEVAEATSMPDSNGAFVDGVAPGTPAEKAGVRVYDVIRKVNDQPVTSANDLMAIIGDIPPGQTVQLEIWRDGATVRVPVLLEPFPEDTRVAVLGKDVLGLRVQGLTAPMIEAMGLDPATKGVIVASVEPDSPAEAAGIAVNDILLEVQKEPVETPEQLREQVKTHAQPGRSLLIRVLKSDNPMPTILTLKIPEDYPGQP
jgi:serine protease Do